MRRTSGLGGGTPGSSWRQTAPGEQLLGSDSAGEGREAELHPGRIGALCGQHRAVRGQLGAAVGAVLYALKSRHRYVLRFR